MNLTYFKTFITVLETGNYSKAADKLDYAQSTITHHIQQLEQYYGGQKLLKRQGYKMMPTPAGELIQQYAQQILDIADTSWNELQKPQFKTIRIGATESLVNSYLPKIIQQMLLLYPSLKIEIQSYVQHKLIDLLKQNEVDFIFSIDQEQVYPDYNNIIIKQEDLVILSHEDHPCTQVPLLTFQDIKSEPLILTSSGCTYRKYLLEIFNTHNVKPNLRLNLGTIESVKQAVTQNLGIGFLPYIATLDLTPPLVAIPFSHINTAYYSQLTYYPEKAEEPIFADFIQIIKQKKYLY